MRRVLTGWISLFAALSLTACGSNPPTVTETRTIEVPVPVYEEVPNEFTEPLEFESERPEDPRNRDMLERMDRCEAVVEQCNKDRQAVEDASWREENGE